MGKYFTQIWWIWDIDMLSLFYFDCVVYFLIPHCSCIAKFLVRLLGLYLRKNIFGGFFLFSGHGDHRNSRPWRFYSLPEEIWEYHLWTTPHRCLSWRRASLATAGHQRLRHESQILELWPVQSVQEHERFICQLRLGHLHFRLIFFSTDKLFYSKNVWNFAILF